MERFGTDEFYRAIGRGFVVACAIVPVLFAVELIDRLLPVDLEAAGGIWPHHISGLDGILFAPFLHDDFAHLYGNSVVLIPLGTFVLASGGARFVAVTAIAMLASGLGVWFTGDPRAIVIGASGVIFGYLGYLLARGLFERSWWNVAVALLIGLLYGGQLAGVLPTNERISWQGHLFGFFGGVLAAVLLRRRSPAGPAELPAQRSIDDTVTDETPLST
ncbi:MAG TPA: rhomboid family intramembrane serine protease [Micromonosporaceae bacterium]|nr:rhomboid family intramembrane serine protease [Micromonosporaceae bacterium]